MGMKKNKYMPKKERWNERGEGGEGLEEEKDERRNLMYKGKGDDCFSARKKVRTTLATSVVCFTAKMRCGESEGVNVQSVQSVCSGVIIWSVCVQNMLY
jgi:hypothetical protein